MTKDALRALAAQAVTKGTGARALRSMLERIMLDIMYDVPSREDIAEVTINRAVVEGRKLPLIRKKQDKDRRVTAQALGRPSGFKAKTFNVIRGRAIASRF